MSTVFAIHEPTRWNHARRCTVPIDLTPAQSYGRLQIVFPGLGEPTPSDPKELTDRMAAAFKFFSPSDYLLMVGKLELVVWAAQIVLTGHGFSPTLLKWDNRAGAYEKLVSPFDPLFK